MNCIILTFAVPRQYDDVYVLGKYTYKDVWRRMLELEKMTGHRQSQLRRFLQTLKRNYHKTGFLNTKRYSKFIEPVFDKTLINHFNGNWVYFWKNSSLFTKIHLAYVLSIPLMFYLAIHLAFNEEEIPVEFFIAMPGLIMVVIMIAVIMIIVNIALYYFYMAFLELANKESGPLNRNVTAIEALTDSMKFYKTSALLLSVAGIMGTATLGKAGGMKGMGGGKFSGGGAGGSW